jgi:flagellar basal-body rod modification protein FlgD
MIVKKRIIYEKIKGGFKMSISALASNLLNSSTASAAGTAFSMSSLKADDFLKLLLVELKNQDPSKPMDSSAMLSQFSTLTQVQQTQQSNNYLQSLLESTVEASNIQAVGYIGKKVSFSGDKLTVAGGTAGTSKFTLASDAGKVSISIYDAAGSAIKTSDLGSKSAGTYSFQWDGTNNSGAKVADGTYTVGFSAKDSAGKNISVTTEASANVTGVVFKNGIAYLVTEAGEIPLTSVAGVT